MSGNVCLPIRDYCRAPSAELDYAWDWSCWLADGETITDQAVTAAPEGLTITNVGSSSDGQRVVAWIAGGALGDAHIVTAVITTDQGRTDARSIRLLTVQR